MAGSCFDLKTKCPQCREKEEKAFPVLFQDFWTGHTPFINCLIFLKDVHHLYCFHNWHLYSHFIFP